MTTDQIKKLIDELATAKNEYSLLTRDEESSQRLGPPATASEIAKLEVHLGSLPRSYRAFVELHNGWAGFSGGAKILSSEDYNDDWVRERVSDLGAAAEDAGAPDPFKSGQPILLGPSEQRFVVMGPPRDGAEERELISYDLQEEMHRFPHFGAFLQHELGLLREMIRRQKEGNPSR